MARCSPLRVKTHTPGGWNTFYVGYIKDKLQLLYKTPHLQGRDINNGNYAASSPASYMLTLRRPLELAYLNEKSPLDLFFSGLSHLSSD